MGRSVDGLGEVAGALVEAEKNRVVAPKNGRHATLATSYV